MMLTALALSEISSGLALALGGSLDRPVAVDVVTAESEAAISFLLPPNTLTPGLRTALRPKLRLALRPALSTTLGRTTLGRPPALLHSLTQLVIKVGLTSEPDSRCGAWGGSVIPGPPLPAIPSSPLAQLPQLPRPPPPKGSDPPKPPPQPHPPIHAPVSIRHCLAVSVCPTASGCPRQCERTAPHFLKGLPHTGHR